MRFHETMHVIVEIKAFNGYSDIILKMLLGKNFPDRKKQGILNQQREKSGQKFRKKVASLMSAVKCRCGSSSKTHPVTHYGEQTQWPKCGKVSHRRISFAGAVTMAKFSWQSLGVVKGYGEITTLF